MGFRIAAQDAHINELKHQIDSYEKLLTSKITDKKSCPFPLCDGRGNLNGKSATDSSLIGMSMSKKVDFFYLSTMRPNRSTSL